MTLKCSPVRQYDAASVASSDADRSLFHRRQNDHAFGAIEQVFEYRRDVENFLEHNPASFTRSVSVPLFAAVATEGKESKKIAISFSFTLL